MLTFEALLVKELQKQQSRAEFCDIVLQSGGVSVPVHSCVLSAFSPFLCGALSAMPSPQNGQKRLLEVQSMESCTLLSLVSLLYTGQLHEDKEDVLSAAYKLGISIPQRSPMRTSSEQNTQTECTTVEKECQTETLSSENPIETLGASLWRSDQGLCTYTGGSDLTLDVALQNIPGNPESMPSLPVMDVVPESAMYATVAAPAPKRRGRPRKYPLPQSNASRNSPPNQKTVNLPAPSLMHTVALPAANPTGLSQPIDWLIDDVIAQLPLMPNNQHTIDTATPDPNPKTQPSVKLTDPAIVQPQSEGELTDILDSFLRTFEQHISVCDADGQDAVMPTDDHLTCGQSTSNAHDALLNTTTLNSISKNRLRPARRPQKPSTYWQLTGMKMEKSPGDQGEEMPAVMTRSQSRKRKQEVIEELLRRDPVKRKKQKKERSEKTRNDFSVAKEAERPTQMLNGEPKHFLSKFEPSKLRKVMNTASANNMKISKPLQQSSDQTCVKRKRTKRDKTKPLAEGSASKMASSTTSSQPLSPNQSRPALSAFDLVKQILESQQRREREHKEHRMWRVKKQKEKDRVKSMHACGAKEKDDGVKMHSNSRIDQRHEEMRGRMEEDQRTTCLLQQQPIDEEHTETRERLMENGFSRCGCETADSVFPRRSTEDRGLKSTADVTLASASPHEKLTDPSDEDVDVVEVSSSLSESFSVLPLTEMEPSTDEEDSDEDQEIDVISVGSH
ncbi:uncharacterized protein isoform X3 [Danio rerio]|uniref:Myoneurin isoform X2 n=3 Tax=Danio rerio TaxID=7955 RepID=A0AB32T7G3_DANRE